MQVWLTCLTPSMPQPAFDAAAQKLQQLLLCSCRNRILHQRVTAAACPLTVYALCMTQVVVFVVTCLDRSGCMHPSCDALAQRP